MPCPSGKFRIQKLLGECRLKRTKKRRFLYGICAERVNYGIIIRYQNVNTIFTDQAKTSGDDPEKDRPAGETLEG